MLTTLQIDARYNPAFLKSLTLITGNDSWGSGPGDVPEMQTIYFDSASADEVVAAINGYDDAWLDFTKSQHTRKVNAMRDDKIENGYTFVSGGETYVIQSTQSDRENVIGLAVAAMGAIGQGALPGNLEWLTPGQPFGFIAADNRTIPLDAQGMMALYQRGLGFKMGVTLYARALKDALLAAPDLIILDGINIEVGWPE